MTKLGALQDQLRQTNERLLLSAFKAQDSAEHANAASALLDAVLRQMPGGVIIVDPLSCKIILSNEAAQTLWPDCTCIADMAHHFEKNCFHSDGKRCNQDEFALSPSMETSSQIPRQKVRFQRRDGSRGDMTIESGIVRNGKEEIIALVLTCEDITQQQMLAERERTIFLQLRDLSAKMESVREDERTRIARELHDELGQLLCGLQLELGALLNTMSRARPAVKQTIRSMIDMTKGIMASMQQLATELRPSILDGLGLIPAIEWQLSEFQRRSGIRANLNAEGDLAIDRDRSTAIFRIIQEALTNVVRHAKATSVSVTLQLTRGIVKLQVNDNGCGIRLVEVASSRSLGIMGMKERVMRFGGDFTIGPHSPEGTQLDVSLPIGVEET